MLKLLQCTYQPFLFKQLNQPQKDALESVPPISNIKNTSLVVQIKVVLRKSKGLRCGGILVTCTPPPPHHHNCSIVHDITSPWSLMLAKCGRRLDQESGSLLASLCALKIFFLNHQIFFSSSTSRGRRCPWSRRAPAPRPGASWSPPPARGCPPSSSRATCPSNRTTANKGMILSVLRRETSLNMVEHPISKEISFTRW